MTPAWHDGPLGALGWDGRAPVAWSVRQEAGDPREERRRLAAALVGHLAGIPARDVRLARSAAGAPVVAWPAGWHIGLSSRGGRCLIGVATRPIGVDREAVDDASPLWDMLTPAEATEVGALAPAERPRAWLRRWTIKEAHAKLVGEPRRIAPEAIGTAAIDASRALARFEGTSRCWTRNIGDAIETVALWDDGSGSDDR